MKKLDKVEVEAALSDRASRGHHVDPRLLREVIRDVPEERFHVITMEDVDSFMSLIWHWHPSSALLTPPGQPRSLRQIVQRMAGNGWSLYDLASEPILHPGAHNPDWFTGCLAIAQNFDYGDFHWIAVNQPTDDERRETPGGTFYIFDGCHKSLVLAHLLATKQIEYQPVEVLLLMPRRTGDA